MLQSAVTDTSQQVFDYLADMGLMPEANERVMEVSWSKVCFFLVHT